MKTLKTIKFALGVWVWKRPTGKAHDGQTLLDWYIEQSAIVLLDAAFHRALMKGDLATTTRIRVVVEAGAIAEMKYEVAR